ncbi:Homeobox KN domain-containing protein [Elsinoe fawcettii]|nr:Homeobox KN domain-containing protein [Elsinoe fawcettii]
MSSAGERGLTPQLERDLEQLLTQELQQPGDSSTALAHSNLPHVSGCPSIEGAGACTCITGLRGMNDLYKSYQAGDKEAEDFANFENWIPTFVKPDQPCDYCRSKGLDCHMYFGKITCTSCNSLFRPCSFARVSRKEGETTSTNVTGKYLQHIDTLHPVQEDVCMERGAYTGTRTLRGTAPATAANSDDGKKSAVRFNRAVVKVLRDWFEDNQDHPYPTDEEKIELERKTGLKSNQITTWLANTRRRSKVGKGTRRAYSPGPSSRRSMSSSQPITVPAATMAKEWRDLNPFERWQHSPPENEPAPMEAIADAVKHSSGLPRPLSASTFGEHSAERGSQSCSKPAQSVASMETGRESSNSRTGTTSSIAWSHGSSGSYGSFNSFGSGLHGKRDRRRKRKVRVPLKKDASDDKKRIFQCTFCCDTFKTKYDWTRHEKTLHLSLEKWICAPLGPIVTDPHTGVKTCVYCREENPSRAHIDSHGHSECESKGLEARTFYRKDHLRQHLRLMHHIPTMQPNMESWKASADLIKSRCGFCDARFISWMERNDHLAAHFKEGAHMREWKRCRGLDPDVAANVLNAMPPYLIGMERDSPVPFSASKGILNHKQVPLPGTLPDDQEGWPAEEWTNTCSVAAHRSRDQSRATCWEILTIELGAYVKSRADAGEIVTDDMIQSQARRILYESDDTWNQTAADNPEWLDLFKKAHGLDIIPTTVEGVGNVVPEDLEFYTDLGMRVPFTVAQKALTSPRTSPPATTIPENLAPRVPGPPPAGTPQQQLDRWSAQQQGGPAAYEKTYKSYDEMPISAARAAHFATRTNNPVITGDMTAAQWFLSQEGSQLTAEEQEQWRLIAEDVMAEQNLMAQNMHHATPASGSGSGSGSAWDSNMASGELTPEELDRMMEDFGMSGMDLTASTGTGTQTPSSGSQMLNTPATGDVVMFDPFPGFAAPVEQEADPMQWVNAEMMDAASPVAKDKCKGVDYMSQLQELNTSLAQNAETRGTVCGGTMDARLESEEFDFGEIQF